MEKQKYSGELKFLDGLRGLAALVVMVGHARWLFWEGFSNGFVLHPEKYSAFEKTLVYFFSLFKFGHEAVLFFFVLSGLVIHLKYSRKLAVNGNIQFDGWDYFKRRFRRIYPPFVFAIMLTFLLDYYGQQSGYSIYSRQTPNSLLNENIGLNHSLVNLIGNLLFWQGGSVGAWGTNGPLWSLKYEWWFYCLYPLLFVVNRKNLLASSIVVALLFIFPFFIETGLPSFVISVMQYLLSWWMGVIIADVFTGRIRIKFGYLAIPAIFIPLMAIWGSRIHNSLAADTLWALGFAGLLSFVFFLYSKNLRVNFLEKLSWLGECSYSLYILHFPIFVLLNGMLLEKTNNVMPKSQGYIIFFSVLMVAIAYGIHFIIEKPFIQKRPKTGLVLSN